MKITVQIPDTKGGQELKKEINALAAQGSGVGLDYLNALANNPNVDWEKVALAHDQWSYDQAGLTGAGAALLTIVVTYFTAGMGTAAVGGTAATAGSAATVMGSTALATAVNVGFSSLASQAAVAMVNNKGDLGKTLEQLGSEQSVQNLLTSMLTAGALDKLNASYFAGVDASSTFGTQLLKNVTNNLASDLMNSALTGKPFDEKTLANSLQGALINTGMAQGAFAIGDAASAHLDANDKLIPAQIDAFTQKVAHAVLGCLGGAAIAGNSSGCAPGAVGAVVGELTAEFAKNHNMSNTDALALAKVMSAVSGVVVGGGGDNAAAVNIAATTGANAAENNYLKHEQVDEMLKKLQDAKTQQARDDILAKYAQISRDQSAAAKGCVGEQCTAIDREITEGQIALNSAQAQIAKYAGGVVFWGYGFTTNDNVLDISEVQRKDSIQVSQNIAVQIVAARNEQTRKQLGVSKSVNDAITKAESCATAECRNDSYRELQALLKTSSNKDAVAIINGFDQISGSASVGGECVQGTPCQALKMTGEVLLASRGLNGAGTGGKTISGKAASGAKTCSFRGDMQVKTINGYTAIRDLRVGDSVFSQDEATGTTSFKQVLAQYSNPYTETMYIDIKDGNGQVQQIVSNTIHPFLLQLPAGETVPPKQSEGHVYHGPIRNAYWVDAANLKPGYKLLGSNQQWMEVLQTKRTQEPLQAYNLTVADFHTYFVKAEAGTDAVWVHNNCWDGLPSGAVSTGKTTPDGRPIYSFTDADGSTRLAYKGVGNDPRFYDPKVYEPTALPPGNAVALPAPVPNANLPHATLTTAELAGTLGYQKTNFLVKGQPVYYKADAPLAERYISPDVGSGNGQGSHNGGIWKAASSPTDLGSKTTRSGTYDANLNRMKD